MTFVKAEIFDEKMKELCNSLKFKNPCSCCLWAKKDKTAAKQRLRNCFQACVPAVEPPACRQLMPGIYLLIWACQCLPMQWWNWVWYKSYKKQATNYCLIKCPKKAAPALEIAVLINLSIIHFVNYSLLPTVLKPPHVKKKWPPTIYMFTGEISKGAADRRWWSGGAMASR